MHVLITADTVGGVWTYTRELVGELARQDVRVTLVSFGGLPTCSQTLWLDALPQVSYFPTAFPLEWMPDSASGIQESSQWLASLVNELRPDFLHLSQFCYGALDVTIPKLVVAHSDALSWSLSVRGRLPQDEWSDWYRNVVARGLAGASLVVAPSRWMLDALEGCYGRLARAQVIYNGRTPALFQPYLSKQNFALSVGRLWDEGKQSRLLEAIEHPAMPILLAGPLKQGAVELGESSSVSARVAGVQQLGPRSELELRQLYSRAAVYVATSCYEPFGLAPLEAALSRCAILASDIPSLREVWGDDALYFRARDAESLGAGLQRLHAEPELRRSYAARALQRAQQRYTAAQMAGEYMSAYSALLERRAWVA